jgi:predicted Zn-dependent protease with MMP-like domain
LPREIGRLIESVEIGVRAKPGKEAGRWRGSRALLGLYVGPTRDEIKAGALDPARIVLYQRNLESACATEAELLDEVAATLRHELGHHFGFGDRRLRGLGH